MNMMQFSKEGTFEEGYMLLIKSIIRSIQTTISLFTERRNQSTLNQFQILEFMPIVMAKMQQIFNMEENKKVVKE